MLERFAAHIAEKEILRRGERILVAFSAGPDSLALLTLLLKLRQTEEWQVAVAHLDHCLRPESIIEAEHVRAICEQLGLTCFQEAEDVAALAAVRKLGIEEAGRDARYRFLLRMARRFQASAVVFGHQADDMLEHFWMRLLRGASPATLSGIPESRDIAPGIRLVRPLLPFSRAEIESYVAKQKFVPFRDPDNQLLEFDRNRIRHQFMPYLDSLHPGWRKHLQTTMEMLGENEDYLRQESVKFYQLGSWNLGLYTYDYHHWLDLHPTVRKRIVLHVFREWSDSALQQPLQYRHLAFLERSWQTLSSYQRLDLPAGRCVQRGGKALFLMQHWPPLPWQLRLTPLQEEMLPLRLSLPWSASGHPAELDCLLMPRQPEGWPNASRDGCYIARHSAGAPWLLRATLPGDKLLVGGHRRKIGELLRARGIPLPMRPCYPMLVVGGRNAALPGLVTADTFLPDDDDRTAFRLSLK